MNVRWLSTVDVDVDLVDREPHSVTWVGALLRGVLVALAPVEEHGARRTARLYVPAAAHRADLRWVAVEDPSDLPY
jgi:hypothetical protein